MSATIIIQLSPKATKRNRLIKGWLKAWDNHFHSTHPHREKTFRLLNIASGKLLKDGWPK